jgi:hypothetical protein
VYSPAGSVPPPSHLTSYTCTGSSLYLDSSFEAVIREPALYKLLPIRVPILLSIFCRIGRLSKESAQVQGSVTILFLYGEGLLVPRPIPKLEDRPLAFVHGCLLITFAATLHSWKPFLHPQPEDVPCCGDRDPPNMYLLKCR